MFVVRIALFCVALTAWSQTTPEAVYKRGREYADRSVQSFEKLVQTAPESAYVLALLGEVKTKEREYTAALYAYNEAAKRMPHLRGIHAAIAEVERALNKPADAEAAAAAEARLGTPNCTVERLYCEFNAGKFDEVVRDATGKTGTEALYWRTRAYNALSMAALTELGKFPDSPELHQVKAQILQDDGEYRQSAEEWRLVLKSAPENREAQHRLAAALYLSHDYQAALPELERILKAEPDSPNLNFFVGDSLLGSEKVQEALPFLETALKLDPRLLPAQASLGLCYGRLGQPAKAIPHLKAALTLDKDGSLHYQLARAYQATGQPEQAKAMMAEYERLRKPAVATAPVPQP